MGKKFWESEPEVWDAVNNVGLRNNYCSLHPVPFVTLGDGRMGWQTAQCTRRD